MKIYLPDGDSAFYQGTRFDRSGMIASLEYEGHHYYAPWFDRIDPEVLDVKFDGEEIIVGVSSAATGPAEEFKTNGAALGWEEAEIGEPFVKIGVGVLRKDEEKYSFAKLYPIIDPGKWRVKKRRHAVEFIHNLKDSLTGYGYEYHKIVRLEKGKPRMIIEHRLRNSGRLPISTTVYNHNFLVLDQQTSGPDFTIDLAYPIATHDQSTDALAEIRGNQIIFKRPLQHDERVYLNLPGFSEKAKDYQIKIENPNVGAGVKIIGDRPLSASAFWSIRSVFSIEPFVSMNIKVEDEFTWSIIYDYYTLPSMGSKLR